MLTPNNKKPATNEEINAQDEPKESGTVLVSHTDAYVHDRMKTQPKTLEDVDVKVRETESEESKHQLTLPDEFNPYRKKYAFRWLMKSKRAIDHACDVRGWVLVNRTHFPDLPKHFWTRHGSMERGDAILAFMPEERAKRLREIPGEISRDMVKSQFEKHKNNPDFYRPKDSETGSRVQMI